MTDRDLETTAKVVESLVVRGDISALSPAERAKHYAQMCESLGLNPMAQPFAILRLGGKEVLYATRGATDQLAAIHKLNREIIDGPKVVDLAGTKMVYAVCRATLPNGRSETAVGTVPLTDHVNALMKCETKAKRRATLSILGLGMLDETEIDTIPSHLRSAGPPVDLKTLEATVEEAEVLPGDEILQRLSADLSDMRDRGEPIRALYIKVLEAQDELAEAGSADRQDEATTALRSALPRGTSGAEVHRWLHTYEWIGHMERASSERELADVIREEQEARERIKSKFDGEVASAPRARLLEAQSLAEKRLGVTRTLPSVGEFADDTIHCAEQWAAHCSKYKSRGHAWSSWKKHKPDFDAAGTTDRRLAVWVDAVAVLTGKDPETIRSAIEKA